MLNRITAAINDGVARAEVGKRHNDTSTTPIFVGRSLNLITWTCVVAVEVVEVTTTLLLMLLLFATNFDRTSRA